MHLDDRLLGMVVQLDERLCRPLQARWTVDAANRGLSRSLDEPGASEIGDALFCSTS